VLFIYLKKNTSAVQEIFLMQTCTTMTFIYIALLVKTKRKFSFGKERIVLRNKNRK
jgi:hypothetical protein